MKPGMNIGDLDRFFQKQPEGIVGKRTRPSAKSEAKKDAPTIREWVSEMDKTNGWPEFEKRVQGFEKEFDIPFSKAVIYILFNVF